MQGYDTAFGQGIPASLFSPSYKEKGENGNKVFLVNTRGHVYYLNRLNLGISLEFSRTKSA